MAFINYETTDRSKYVGYDSEVNRGVMNLNDIKSLSSMRRLPKGGTSSYTRMSPFQGRGLYNPNSQPLYDDCFTNPFNGHYATQGNCAKLSSSTTTFRPITAPSVDQSGTANPSNLSNMRQNGSHDLPDHFSRFGYNDQTRGCSNGYCVANHNGRYICGNDEIGQGIYATPTNMAPQSWYDKKAAMEQDEYWFPYTPKPLAPGY
jgi:hypothetical protein